MSTETITAPVSTQPAASTTPKTASEKKTRTDKGGTHKSPDYSTAAMTKKSNKTVDAASGISDPDIIAGCATVTSSAAQLAVDSGLVGAAEVELAAAETAWTPVLANLVLVLEPVAALLIRGIRGGDEFYRRCRNGHAPWVTANNIVNQLPAGGLGLPAEMISKLGSAVTSAKPAYDALVEARTAKVEAGKNFTTTKAALNGSIVLLNARVRSFKMNQKYGAFPAPVATPVTGSGGKATNP